MSLQLETSIDSICVRVLECLLRWAHRLALFCGIAWIAAEALPAQRTWVVDDTMAAGTDFPDLVSAYAAAVPGDRIHIRFGSGQGYRAPASINKALTIVGLGTTKPIVVHSLVPISCPAQQVLVFDNLDFRADANGLATSVENSLGTVLLSRISYPGALHDPVNTWNAHRVVMVDCVVTAPVQAVAVQGSKVWLLNCVTRARSAGDPNYTGDIQIRCGGFLTVVGGQHQGGDGLGDCYPLSPGFLGEAAIYAGQGPAVVSGPARLVGGLIQAINPVCGAGSSQGRWGAISSNCAPGISGTVIDPMVVRDGGGPGAGCPLDQIREMPAVIPAPAVRGQPQNIETWGPTGSIVAVFASFMTPFDPIVLPIGDVWLDPSLTLHVASGAVDSQRHVRFTTTIPSWLEIGDVLVYQAVSLSSQSLFEISAPGIAVVH
ncbi:MAG: hypothetical protein U1F36_19875 [Planctomycetota bacterium]